MPLYWIRSQESSRLKDHVRITNMNRRTSGTSVCSFFCKLMSKESGTWIFMDIPHVTERLKKVAGWGKAHQRRQSHGNDPWLHGRRDHNFEAAVDGMASTQNPFELKCMRRTILNYLELNCCQDHIVYLFTIWRGCAVGSHVFTKLRSRDTQKVNVCVPLQTIWFVLCSNQKGSAKIDTVNI